MLQDNCQETRPDASGLYGKISFDSPRSSVDRVLASEAEDRSSSLRGGTTKSPLVSGFFYLINCLAHTIPFLDTIDLCITKIFFFLF